MQINIQTNSNNITILTITPDTDPLYAVVTMDGNMPGSYSVLTVPSDGWDDAAVKANVLNWFSLTEQ